MNFLNGDDNAAMYFFRSYNRKIFLYCAKLVNNTHVAEDITQEVWERIIKLRNQSHPEIANPGGFMFTIARNLCLNHIKLRKHTIPIDAISEIDIPHEFQPGSTDMEELVNSSLDSLKFEDKELLVLNMFCGYRFDEIAEMMGMSPNAIWTRASRARAQLREKVKKMINKDFQ
ncbi:MAG: RNA polymerase sigma factor [Candidatus Kapaibacteriota bacterium]|jgi:RNA polymerase sigma-70 factor (ECF subfamily)